MPVVQVSVSTKVQGGRLAHPTVSLNLERDYIGLPSRRPARRAQQPAEKPAEQPVSPAARKAAVPAPAEASSLAERLRRLDAAYEAEFARLGKRGAGGVESLSYKR